PSNGKLKCRLGGVASNIGGIDYIIGTEENVSVIAMVTGKSAPQPPKPPPGAYRPGCIVGGQLSAAFLFHSGFFSGFESALSFLSPESDLSGLSPSRLREPRP